MVTKPCKRCGTEIEFKVGISRSVGKQPFRSHATCPACGAKHYVMVENRSCTRCTTMTKRGTDPLIYYHRAKGADAILRDGFRDGEGTYLTDRMRRGVWLSDQPLSAMEGAGGSHTIEVDIPEDLSDFEWVEEGKPYREWLVPAELVNRYPRRLVED